MANRVQRPLKVIALNENGILRQRYELGKQLQDIHIDVALFSEILLKPHERFLTQKAELPLQSKKASPTIM
jgi:hypothetical protein